MKPFLITSNKNFITMSSSSGGSRSNISEGGGALALDSSSLSDAGEDALAHGSVLSHTGGGALVHGDASSLGNGGVSLERGGS